MSRVFTETATSNAVYTGRIGISGARMSATDASVVNIYDGLTNAGSLICTLRTSGAGIDEFAIGDTTFCDTGLTVEVVSGTTPRWYVYYK